MENTQPNKGNKNQGQRIENSTIMAVTMQDVNHGIPAINLNVNGFNIPIKRQRLSNWINKEPKYLTYSKPI